MANENTPNYWNAVAPLATPVDTVRNPDVDAAMGFAANPNDDDATAFAKGLQSSLFRNSPQGRDVTEAFVKQKLANQLTMQLEEQKEQLAQKYPTYQFQATPWGATRVMNPKTGTVTEANSGGQDAADDPNSPQSLYMNNFKAQMQVNAAKAATESRPEYQSAVLQEALAKPALQKAETDYYTGAKTTLANAKAAEDAAVAEAKRHPPAKPLTAQAQQALLTAAQAEAAMVSPKDPMAGMKISGAMKNDPTFNDKVISIYNRKVQEYQNQQQGNNSNSSGPPDISGLFSPLNVD